MVAKMVTQEQVEEIIDEAYNQGHRAGIIAGVKWVADQIEEHEHLMTLEHLKKMLLSLHKTSMDMNLEEDADGQSEEEFTKKVKENIKSL